MGRVAAVRHDHSPPPRTLGQCSPETNRSRSIGGQIGRQNGNGNGRESGGSRVLSPSLFLFPLFSFLFVVVRPSLAWDIGKREMVSQWKNMGIGILGRNLVNGLPLRARAPWNDDDDLCLGRRRLSKVRPATGKKWGLLGLFICAAPTMCSIRLTSKGGYLGSL